MADTSGGDRGGESNSVEMTPTSSGNKAAIGANGKRIDIQKEL